MKTILSITIFFLSYTILSAQEKPTDWNEYSMLNESENRLIDYKDSEETLQLKLQQLEVINKSRKKHRAQPVKLDILASRVGNKMAKEAAENKFHGHYNLKGEKPYHRYAFEGGNDHVTENAAASWTTGTFDVSNASIAIKMASSHQNFMNERAPNDGHKQNCIDNAHNYVGIGFYISNQQFRYYEEFINRYLVFEDFSREIMTGETVSLKVKPIDKNYLHYLIVFKEDFPKPMSIAKMNRTGSYPDYTNNINTQKPAWELAKLKDGDTYNIPLSFSSPGLYYIQLYISNKELTSPEKISTKGKTKASSIVITVKE